MGDVTRPPISSPALVLTRVGTRFGRKEGRGRIRRRGRIRGQRSRRCHLTSLKPILLSFTGGSPARECGWKSGECTGHRVQIWNTIDSVLVLVQVTVGGFCGVSLKWLEMLEIVGECLLNALKRVGNRYKGEREHTRPSQKNRETLPTCPLHMAATGEATRSALPVRSRSTQSPDSSHSHSEPVYTPQPDVEAVMAMGVPRYLMPMIAPGTPGAPYFNGSEATDFLLKFNETCDDFGVRSEDRAARVVRYCKQDIGNHIRMSAEYQDRDWKALQKAILKEWKKYDGEQRVCTLTFLEELKNRKRTTRDEIRQYCLQYRRSSRALLKNGMIAPVQQCKWFLQGLPDDARRMAIRKLRIDDEEAETMNFEKAYDFIIRYCDEEDRMARICDAPEEVAAVQKLADRLNTAPKAGPLEETGVIAQTIRVESNEMPVVAMDEMTAMMQNLKLASARIAEMTNQYSGSRAIPRARPLTGLDPALTRNAEALPQEFSDKLPEEPWFEYFRRRDMCNFCEAPRCRAMTCPTRQRMINEGIICLAENRLCMGTPEMRNPPIDFRGCAGGQIRRVKQLSQAATPESKRHAVGVSSIRISEIEEDTDDDASEEYEALGVAAGRIARTRQPSKKMVDNMGSKIHKDSQFPPTKTARHGVYRPRENQNSLLQAVETQLGEHQEPPRPLVGQSGDGLPSRPSWRQRATYEGPQKLMNALKGIRGAEKMAQAVLSAPVAGSNNMEVRDYLAIAEVRQLVFSKKTWEQDGVGNVVLAQNSGRAVPDQDIVMVNAIQVRTTPPSYQECPKFWVKVARHPGFALYDTGSMANVMSKGNADMLGIPIEPLGNVRAVSFGGEHTRFYGCMRDVPIEVNGVSACTDVYVVEHLDPAYDMILGLPFMSATRAAAWHDAEDQIHLRFQDLSSGQSVEIMAAATDDGDDGPDAVVGEDEEDSEDLKV